MIRLVPLVLVIAVLLGFLAAMVDRRADRLVTHVSLFVFGTYVAERSPRRYRQRDLLRAAHRGGSHRVYASRTLLYATVLGVAGSVIGVYLVAGLLAALGVGHGPIVAMLPDSLSFLAGLTGLTNVTPFELFVLLVTASGTVGTVLAYGTYYARWTLLEQRALGRAAEIDVTLARTVAFIYALSRSGMAFPRVMDTLAEHEHVYGEAAAEIAVAVRDMNTFGTDSLTALRRTASRTPSEDLAEFAENLASVLGSGQSLSSFLADQYERYQEEAESRQRQYLELLSTFAEAYVTALVAGPLFFITILVVIGLVLEDTLPLIRVVVYVGIPLATVAFVVYVDSVTHGVGGSEQVDRSERLGAEGPLPDGGIAAGGSSEERARRTVDRERVRRAVDRDRTSGRSRRGVYRDGVSEADGRSAGDDWQISRERLDAYENSRNAIAWMTSPIAHVLARPAATLVVTIPIAVAWIAIVGFPLPEGSPTRMIGGIDSTIISALAFVFGGYAVVYEFGKRRTRRIEAVVPDLLDRLASINEAGTSIVDSVWRVASSDLEALSPELERTTWDIYWGADVTTALERLDRRVRSPVLSRAVTLVTNASHASGDLAPVLKIAADETRSTQRLRRDRKQTMLTYLIVIYLSFLVFVGIIAALMVAFIPAIEDAVIGTAPDAGATMVGGIGAGISDIDVFAYEQLFLHAAAIQAVGSGLVAGQLGEGSVRDGVKHAVVLLIVTGIAFTLMGSF